MSLGAQRTQCARKQCNIQEIVHIHFGLPPSELTLPMRVGVLRNTCKKLEEAVLSMKGRKARKLVGILSQLWNLYSNIIPTYYSVRSVRIDGTKKSQSSALHTFEREKSARRPEFSAKQEAYSNLQQTICTTKWECFKELCAEANLNPCVCSCYEDEGANITISGRYLNIPAPNRCNE